VEDLEVEAWKFEEFGPEDGLTGHWNLQEADITQEEGGVGID
jgi:hypothetical protein